MRGMRALRAVLPLLLVLQASGVVPMALDAIAGEVHSPCEGEADEDDCPPQCPTCTCAHAARPAVQPGPVSVAVLPPAIHVTPLTALNQPHCAPYPHGIFHPPRA